MIPRVVRIGVLLFCAWSTPSGRVLAAIEGGSGDIGEWELVWRYDEANGERNEFASMHAKGYSFPIAWRVYRDTRGHRLQFYDDRGEPGRVIELGPDDHAIASENGEAWVILAPDSSDTQASRIRYFRGNADRPLWEAFVTGAPLLLTPYGDALVLGTQIESRDRFSRIVDARGGRLQVLGGEAGEVCGELPILPSFARAAGDGRKLAFLHDKELFLLGVNGKMEWKRDVPVDNLRPRGELSHLATGGDLVVVCGTGDEPNPRRLMGTLRPQREECLVVFDLAGKVVWELDTPESDELRFNYSCALSPDGSTLATLRDAERHGIVALYDARTGRAIAEHRVPRQPSSRTLSVAIGGELVALVNGDLRTGVAAWDREGKPIFAGMLPFRCQVAKVHDGGLLVAEHWIVRLSSGDDSARN
jgi:hypothetical protein